MARLHLTINTEGGTQDHKSYEILHHITSMVSAIVDKTVVCDKEYDPELNRVHFGRTRPLLNTATSLYLIWLILSNQSIRSRRPGITLNQVMEI